MAPITSPHASTPRVLHVSNLTRNAITIALRALLPTSSSPSSARAVALGGLLLPASSSPDKVGTEPLFPDESEIVVPAKSLRILTHSKLVAKSLQVALFPSDDEFSPRDNTEQDSSALRIPHRGQAINLKWGRWGPRSRLLKRSAEDKWLVYQSRLSKHEHLLTIVDRFPTSSWMSLVPDEAHLCSLYLPGTHQSLAFYGGPISTCQSRSHPLTDSLENGCRFIDFRFKLTKESTLVAFHGIQNQVTTAIEAFDILYAFIQRHPAETIIVSVKQENRARGFANVLMDLLYQRTDLWYTNDRWPTMGEARGRLVLFCRFDFNHEKEGLHPIRWPHNLDRPFLTPISDPFPPLEATYQPTAVIQDWYSIGSFLKIPEKTRLVMTMFHYRNRPSDDKSSKSPERRRSSHSSSTPEPRTLNYLPPGHHDALTRISFLSASSLFTAFPSIVAKGFGFGPSNWFGFQGVNARVLDQMLRRGLEDDWKSPTGESMGMIWLVDFWEAPLGLIELMVAWNGL
ncbi:BZ3500_MvSof-1268-A1-R1_Chr5-1g07622 [Microbotryum saponariae]|uniref:BZ3500_MvSof-1268-A1-R1_Chr5-1g07622 protein n=1 Tax=Microbotryum saponariae TaxID=289078 RepID=A0A2X0M0Y0_9BASI|nr:BZ3500_MvSof-1268-A1-R1_Chr5-1g07622 [Microbotryum saponariae]SDA05493.1 BZ3501_MvSof-1269-A2-R1_Chr5-2g07446 [Microbotryum saponariae]